MNGLLQQMIGESSPDQYRCKALLDLKDAMFTIDAMGSQRKIASQIVARGGDYVLQVKGTSQNSEKLRPHFIGIETGSYAHTPCDTAAQSTKGTGASRRGSVSW